MLSYNRMMKKKRVTLIDHEMRISSLERGVHPEKLFKKTVNQMVEKCEKRIVFLNTHPSDMTEDEVDFRLDELGRMLACLHSLKKTFIP